MNAAFFANLAFQGTLLLAGSFVTALVVRRRAASVRHLLWWLTMSALVVLPLTTLLAPESRLGVIRTQRSVAPTEARVPPDGDTFHAVVSASASEATPPIGLSARHLVAAIWLAGMAWMIGRSLRHFLRIARLVRRSRHHPHALCGTRRYPAAPVRACPGIPVPFVWGFFRPVVLLPSCAEHWTDERLDLVIRHELAHIRRKDHVTLLLAHLGRAVHWFNPLAWIALANLEREQEAACDDEVLASGARPSAYARLLLDAASPTHAWSAVADVPAMRRSPSIERRIVSVLDPTVPRGARARRKLGTASALLGVTLFAAVVRIWAAPAAPTSLLTALQNPDHDVRLRAAWMIGELQDPRGVGPLTALLHDRYADIRAQAARSLGDIARSEPVPELVRTLDDPDENVRLRTAHALGDIRDTAARSALTRVAVEDRSRAVRDKANWAIREIDEADPGYDALEKVEDPNPRVRERAAHDLGDRRNRAAFAALAAALHDDDPRVQAQAAWALGEIGDSRAIPPLRALADRSRGDVRTSALNALRELIR